MSRSKQPRALIKEELREAVLICFRSAEELLADAELLCSGRRYARAVFSACIGIEELGKASVALELYDANLPFGSEREIKNFWSFWRDHRSKVAYGDGYYRVNVEVLEKLAPDLVPKGHSTWREFEDCKNEIYGTRSGALLTIKEGALYVDFVDRGTNASGFRLPSATFKLNHAERFLQLLMERIERIRGRVKGLGWIEASPYPSNWEYYEHEA